MGMSSEDEAGGTALSRRTFGKLTLSAALGGAVCGGFAPTYAAPEEDGVLRLGLITPPPHYWNRAGEALSQSLAEATGGRLRISLFPSGQLGSESQMLQLLQIGALDMAFLTTSELVNRLRAFAAFYTPYLVRDASEAAQLLSGPTAMSILKDVNRIGLHGLGYGMGGLRQVVTRQKVKTLADLRGRKVRVVPDGPLMDFWKLAGTSPTPIPLSSLYDAFANGQIDAMHIDLENTLKQKYYAHAGSVLRTDHMIFPMVAVVSQRSWAKLSAPDRHLIETFAGDVLAGVREIYATADDEFRAGLEANGVEVTRLDESFFATAQRAWDARWASRASQIAALKAEADLLRQEGAR